MIFFCNGAHAYIVGIASIYGKIFKLHICVWLVFVSNLHFNGKDVVNDFDFKFESIKSLIFIFELFRFVIKSFK